MLGYRVLLNIIPEETERIRQMMEDFGLNPDDVHEDNSTPIGIGNLCGNNVVRDRANDGANQVYYEKLFFNIYLLSLIFLFQKYFSNV